MWVIILYYYISTGANRSCTSGGYISRRHLTVQSNTFKPMGVVERSLWIHSCSSSRRTLRDSLESGSFLPNCRTWRQTSLRPE